MKWRLLYSRRALCSLLVSFVYAIGASAQTLTLQRNAVSGALVSIAQERSWDRSTCDPRTVAVNILDQPTNGTVTIREETLRIPDATQRGGSSGPCSGRAIIGKQLYYQSKPGFVGADRIVYATTYGGSQTQQTVINVNDHEPADAAAAEPAAAPDVLSNRYQRNRDGHRQRHALGTELRAASADAHRC
jgi:hypothetical protein